MIKTIIAIKNVIAIVIFLIIKIIIVIITFLTIKAIIYFFKIKLNIKY